MISHIKQKCYQRRRLFREDNETTAISFQRIIPPRTSDEQNNSNISVVSITRMHQMVQSFPDDLEARSMRANRINIIEEFSSSFAGSTLDARSVTSSRMIIASHHESFSSSTSSSKGNDDNAVDFGMRQEELSIIQRVDEILSKN